MYSLVLHREALKFYKRLQPDLRDRVFEALNLLQKDPLRRDIDIKALRGELKGKHRLRLGDIRIVYKFEYETRRIFVLAISWRGSAY